MELNRDTKPQMNVGNSGIETPKKAAKKIEPKSFVKPLMIAVIVALTAWGGHSMLTYNDVDDISAQVTQERAAQFEAAYKSPLVLDEVGGKDVELALSRLHMDPVQAEMLKANVTSGKSRLLMLGLTDFAVEDGDVVQVAGGGLTLQVPIYNGTNFVVIPAPAEGAVDVTVTGVADGGGGITINGFGPNGVLPLPTMAVGQSVSFQVQ